MHELSIAHAIVVTVADAVPGRRVERVRLVVGMLAGVVPEALHFGWEVACAGTLLEGSVLDIEHLPLAATCLDCQAPSTHDAPPPWTCPDCGGRALPADDGRTLEVLSVDVADEVEEAHP